MNNYSVSDVFDEGMVDYLAGLVHESYQGAQTVDGVIVDTLKAGPGWLDLAEEFKEQNRAQVRAIPAKLEAIGYRVVRGGRPFKPTIEQRKAIAALEHTRWMELKLQQGYVYGPERDDRDPKTHPDLKPWDELNETAKAKDLQAADLISMLLREAGLGVVGIETDP